VNSRRPLIAINGLYVEAEVPYLKLAERYARCVLKSGGLPVVLPPLCGPLDIAQYVDRVDGFLLTGGDDFETERIGLGPTHEKATPTCAVKQDQDLVLARDAVERGIPILGICYGMQLLGLADGAGILQHLPEDRPGCQEHSGNVTHSVQIQQDSKLHRAVGVEELDVVSQHHQALTDLPSPWNIVARDSEGLIEAIEHDEHPFAVGVQWHPEKSPEGSLNAKLFDALVHAAGLNAARRSIAKDLGSRPLSLPGQ
jgi:putative glutamine amidotransferase